MVYDFQHNQGCILLALQKYHEICQLREATIQECELEGAEIRDCDLSMSVLLGGAWDACDLRSSRLDGLRASLEDLRGLRCDEEQAAVLLRASGIDVLPPDAHVALVRHVATRSGGKSALDIQYEELRWQTD